MKTLDELIELSRTEEGKDKLRFMLAELVGWTFTPFKADGSGLDDVAVLPPGVKFEDEGAVWKYAGTSCPNYPRDLNACHEVEGTVLDLYVYGQTMATVIMVYSGSCRGLYPCIVADALMRTIALILTLQSTEHTKP